MTRSIYWLLAKEVSSTYGKVLDPVEPVDPCADLSAEESAEESSKVRAEICAARRLVTRVQLNQWLAGLFDGRVWVEGWEP